MSFRSFCGRPCRKSPSSSLVASVRRTRSTCRKSPTIWGSIVGPLILGTSYLPQVHQVSDYLTIFPIPWDLEKQCKAGESPLVPSGPNKS